MRLRLGIAVVCATYLLTVVSSASGYIFWSAYDSAKSKIGRAALDGGGVNQELVSGIYFGQGVGTDGNYVYWGESGSNPKLAQIGRAGIDGSNPNHAFQQGATYCGIFDIVATATDLYWLKNDCSGLSINTRIDRAANTGGQGYSEPGAGSYVCGFDVDANYVYWSEGHYIARAPNTVPPQLPDKTWLDVGSVSPCAVAVDSGHVYWTQLLGAPTYRGTNIGRADIDGAPTSVNNSFITGASFTNASGLDVSGGYLYWANSPPPGELQGSIGRASADGTGVAQFFISPVFNPNSIDVDSAGPQPAPPGSQGSGPPPIGPLPRPLIVGVSSSNGSFAPGGGSTAIHARPASISKKAVPRGTVFSYTLDQSADVTIEIKKAKAGRLVGAKCKKPKKSNAKKKKCDLPAHTLYRSGKAGKNEVPYTGRVNGKALTSGRYAAVFTAKGQGGTSNSASVSFAIVKP